MFQSPPRLLLLSVLSIFILSCDEEAGHFDISKKLDQEFFVNRLPGQPVFDTTALVRIKTHPSFDDYGRFAESYQLNSVSYRVTDVDFFSRGEEVVLNAFYTTDTVFHELFQLVFPVDYSPILEESVEIPIHPQVLDSVSFAINSSGQFTIRLQESDGSASVYFAFTLYFDTTVSTDLIK